MQNSSEKKIKKDLEFFEQILTKEVPLRAPGISILHILAKEASEIYRRLKLEFQGFQQKYPSWQYLSVNCEQILFEILDDYGYTDQEMFVKSCTREDLANDLSASAKDTFINKIKSKINDFVDSYEIESFIPFVLVENIHACYYYIQTKDIIVEIINRQNALILIPYIEKRQDIVNTEYKNANYNVNTRYWFDFSS